jgi:hypothetical protein
VYHQSDVPSRTFESGGLGSGGRKQQTRQPRRTYGIWNALDQGRMRGSVARRLLKVSGGRCEEVPDYDGDGLGRSLRG